MLRSSTYPRWLNAADRFLKTPLARLTCVAAFSGLSLLHPETAALAQDPFGSERGPFQDDSAFRQLRGGVDIIITWLRIIIATACLGFAIYHGGKMAWARQADAGGLFRVAVAMAIIGLVEVFTIFFMGTDPMARDDDLGTLSDDLGF